MGKMVTDKNAWIHELLYISYKDLPLPDVLKIIFEFLSVHMPITYLGIYKFFSGTMTRIAIYSPYENLLLSPETFRIPEELVKATRQDNDNSGTWSGCRVANTEGDFPHEIITKMLHPSGGTSIYMPLDYWVNYHQSRFISLHCAGACEYTQEQVDLCEEIRKPVGAALRDIFDRESGTRSRTPGVFPRRDESQCQTQAFHSLDEHVAQYIRHVIQHTNGRISGKNGAASILGLPPTTLWSKMRKLKINSGHL